MILAHWISAITLIIISVSSMKGTPVWVPPTAISASSVSIEEAVESWRSRWATGGTSTAKGRRYATQYFLEHCASLGPLTLLDVSEEVMRTFVDARFAKNEAPATVRQRFDLLYKMFRDFERDYPDFRNPATWHLRPRVDLYQPEPQGFTADEGKAIRAKFKTPRDRALFEVLYRVGFRGDEARTLERRHYDQERRLFVSFRRKAIGFQTLVVADNVAEHLDVYLPDRELALRKSEPLYDSLSDEARGRYPLFVSPFSVRSGEPESYRLSPKTVYNIVRVAGDRAYIDGARPHRARHAFGHDYIQLCGDIGKVAEAMGHASTRTTLKYTQRTHEEQRKGVNKLS